MDLILKRPLSLSFLLFVLLVSLLPQLPRAQHPDEGAAVPPAAAAPAAGADSPPVHAESPPVHHEQPPSQPPVHEQPPPVHHQPPPEHHQPPSEHHQPPPEHHQQPPEHHQQPSEHQQPPPVHHQQQQQQPPPIHEQAAPPHHQQQKHPADQHPESPDDQAHLGAKRVPSVLLPSEPNEFDTRSMSFVFLLPSRGKQCFYHKATSNFSFEYQVTNGGSLDIDVFINSPGGKLAFDRRGKAYGETTFGYDAGRPQERQMPAYMICLDNRYSSWHDKLVYFNLEVESGRDIRRQGSDHLSEDVRANLKELELSWDEFYKSTDKVEDHLLRTIYHLSKSRNNENRDRMMMEDSNSRVNTWSIFQLVVMLFVAGIQVLMIRSLFDDKSKLHRVWKAAK